MPSKLINNERMLNDFTDIIAIDSPSLKESKMAAALRPKLEAIGFTVYEDSAGAIAGGDCGNLIAYLQPNIGGGGGGGSDGGGGGGGGSGGASDGGAAIPIIAMLAHMDTVGPCENKRWLIDGNIIRSDGATILGGDDAAGIVATLEIVRRITEAGTRHGGILIIYTIAEETGLDGAKNIDLDLIRKITHTDRFPQYCFVFDSGGSPGSVVSSAPSHTDVIITVNGMASHAGIEPEKGINAIAALAEAIAQMPLGRIDNETTANIGIVRGGQARNVVCATAVAEGEARSHNADTLARQVAKMKECVTSACERRGATYDFKEITSYNAFSLTLDDPIIKLLATAAQNCGHEFHLVPTGGGSDASVLNAMGIPAANLPVGMHKVHSVEEYTDLGETAQTVDLIVEAFSILASRLRA